MSRRPFPLEAMVQAMATEATFTVPSDQFPLGTVFEQLPDVTVELERIIPAQDVVIPYFGSEVLKSMTSRARSPSTRA